MSHAERARVHVQTRRTITAHFAGRASPTAVDAMHAHLRTCDPCRRRYEQHRLFAQLDPRAPSTEQRIAIGLGLRAPTRDRRRAVALWALALPVIAATVLLWPPVSSQSGRLDLGEPTARGARTAAQALWVYRVDGQDRVRMADGAMGRGDELAFAYSNPAGKPFLMIFAVDDQRHVYWFHPAWSARADAPVAIHAQPGPGPHELPEAISHGFTGQHLELVALFSEESWTTQAVEWALAAAPDMGTLPSIAGGSVVVRRRLELQP